MTTATGLGQRWRYAPLLHHLTTLAAVQPSVRLSLAAIETLIGGPLPRTACEPSYWTRLLQRYRAVPGFTAHCDYDEGVYVVFTRLQP